MIDIDKYFFNGEITDGKVLRQQLINDLLEDIIKTNKELQALKEWEQANKPTGICETCTDKSVELADTLRKENKELKEERNKLREILIMTKRILREIAVRNPISNCWIILANCDECHKKNNCNERPDIQAKIILSKINDMEERDNGN
jgi:hypothetical protein